MQIHLLWARFPGSSSWNRLVLPCYYTRLRLTLVLTLGLFRSIFKKRCTPGSSQGSEGAPCHLPCCPHHVASAWSFFPDSSSPWLSLTVCSAAGRRPPCTGPLLPLFALRLPIIDVLQLFCSCPTYTHLRGVVGLRCSLCHPNSGAHVVTNSITSGVNCVTTCVLNSCLCVWTAPCVLPQVPKSNQSKPSSSSGADTDRCVKDYPLAGFLQAASKQSDKG